MTETMEELLRGPDKLEHIYIHRKNKDYVIAITRRDNETGKIDYQCLVSDTGFNGIPAIADVLIGNALPKPANNIYVAAASLSKYLKKIGYKGVTTIVQTKTGAKLK